MFAHGHYPTSHYVETYWPPGLGQIGGRGKKGSRKGSRKVTEEHDVLVVEPEPSFSIEELRNKKNKTKQEEEFLIFMAQILDMLE